MPEIFLVRHGQASFGAQDYDELSPLGRTQSRALGRWLRAQGIRFDAAWCGERVRQRDTALLALAEMGQALEPGVDAAFNELDADRLLRHAVPRILLQEPALWPVVSDLPNQRDAARQLFERVVDEWVRGAWDGAGIGNWEAFRTRVEAAVAGLLQRYRPGQRVVVFTSGGPITAMLQSLGHHAGGRLDWGIANTSITRIGPDGLRERCAIPHLQEEPGLVTHL